MTPWIRVLLKLEGSFLVKKFVVWLWKPKLFYCIRDSVTTQLNPVHTFVPCFCNCWPGFKKRKLAILWRYRAGFFLVCKFKMRFCCNGEGRERLILSLVLAWLTTEVIPPFPWHWHVLTLCCIGLLHLLSLYDDRTYYYRMFTTPWGMFDLVHNSLFRQLPGLVLWNNEWYNPFVVSALSCTSFTFSCVFTAATRWFNILIQCVHKIQLMYFKNCVTY